MKSSIILFLSICVTNLFGQYATLEIKNKLLIHPEVIEHLTPSIINHFESNYTALKSELETELNASRLDINLEQLEKELEILTTCLENWEWERSNDKTLDFINNHDSEKCYELFSKEGHPIMEFDIIKKENSEIKFVHSQKVNKLIRKAKYIRILDPNCKSPKEKDCYKACLQQYPPLYEIRSNNEKVTFENIPSNWYVNEENNLIIYEIQLQSNHQIIHLETGQEVMLSKWTEVDCY